MHTTNIREYKTTTLPLLLMKKGGNTMLDELPTSRQGLDSEITGSTLHVYDWKEEELEIDGKKIKILCPDDESPLS